ncbi:type VII secretion system-associated protein [Streptomyces scabiei]|uniref:type VII secretion system-associated protein n=1 Tax=Streptomyces scabiei TaxID=1930 RepID=UPI0036EF3427
MSKPTERGGTTQQPDQEAQNPVVESAVATRAPEASEGGDAEARQIEGATENMPPVPDEIREAARLAPDHWLGMVDPTWNGEGAPPAWAVVGQWRSGLDGEIVEWQDNEEYRPSPTSLGWPEPADAVDAAVQLAATGYGPGEDVTRALAELQEAAVFVTSDGDPLSATAPDGETPVVPLFTSPVHLHTSGRLAFELLSVSEVLDRLPEGHLLYLNPSAAVSMTVETDALREALAGGTAEALDEEAADHVTPARPATTSGTVGTARPSAEPSGEVEDVSSETAQSLL